MRKTRLRKVAIGKEEEHKKKAEETEELHKLFKALWDEREDEAGNCYCFETGAILHGAVYRSRSTCYHHVLEKGQGSYPEYKFLKENIIIVSPETHERVGKSIDNCPKIKAYRENLLQKLKKEEDGRALNE
jgi:hypothetical protein